MNENLATVLKKSLANLQRGFESVGGKLTLTPEQLRFESHALNLQRGSTVIDLGAVAEIHPGWAKFFGILPISNNAFVVTLRDGNSHRFIVRSRDGWMDAVRAAVKALNAA